MTILQDSKRYDKVKYRYCYIYKEMFVFMDCRSTSNSVFVNYSILYRIFSEVSDINSIICL